MRGVDSPDTLLMNMTHERKADVTHHIVMNLFTSAQEIKYLGCWCVY